MVGVDGAAHLLKNGDIVEMDGVRGTIKVLKSVAAINPEGE